MRLQGILIISLATLGGLLNSVVNPVAVEAAPLTVDGALADWGVSVADNNLSTYVAAPGLNIIAWFVEDQDDNAGDGGFVGPNHGGQNYDAEWMGAATQSGFLHLGILSGQRPDNGLARYEPGDIRIDTDVGSFGIEVGGSQGGGPGTAITAGATGATYTLDGSGFTAAYNAADPAQVAGSIWFNPIWLASPPINAQTQLQIAGGGTLAGTADYVFTRNSVTTQHSIIELSLPLSIFSGQTIQSISWQPACGNDIAIVATLPIPEPSALVLAAVAILGLTPVLRRRQFGRMH